jgi:GYF domain 2
MANYKVIGGDLKQYGPVSEEEVRKWIADGRLNAMSLAQVYGDIEWKPLSAFPEFGEVLTGKPGGLIPPLPAVPAEDGERQTALQRVKGPAVALKITAILNILLAVWSLVRMTIFPPDLQRFNSELHQLNNPQLEQLFHQWIHMAYGPFGIANSIFGLAMSALIFIGATKMQSLRSYEFAMTAAILAMVPCLTPCCVIGLPFGIWAVVALSKAGVKSQFH